MSTRFANVAHFSHQSMILHLRQPCTQNRDVTVRKGKEEEQRQDRGKAKGKGYRRDMRGDGGRGGRSGLSEALLLCTSVLGNFALVDLHETISQEMTRLTCCIFRVITLRFIAVVHHARARYEPTRLVCFLFLIPACHALHCLVLVHLGNGVGWGAVMISKQVESNVGPDRPTDGQQRLHSPFFAPLSGPSRLRKSFPKPRCM